MEWVPTPEGLSQLLQLLKDSVSPNNEIHNMIQQPSTGDFLNLATEDLPNYSNEKFGIKLDSFNKIPDYPNYLAYILTQMPQEEASTRAIAGLLLKNNIRVYFATIPREVLVYVKTLSIKGLGDLDAMVRGIIGSVITTIVTRGGLADWPQVLTALMELLDSQDYNVVEGAFGALQKICEDSSRELDQDIEGQRPLNFMIPKIITFFDSQHVKIRVFAVSCINQFILMRSNSLFIHIDAFVAALFKRASDENPEVRKNVCQALVMLLEVRPDKLMPEIANVVEYMLFSTQDQDEQVALEACEFWLAFAEQEDLREHLRPFLPRIVPVLLKCMVYSDMDILTLGGDEDDTNVPDSEQDIKPRFHRAKTHTFERTEANGGTSVDGDTSTTNCSAAALDVLATVFGNELLEILLPFLREQLFHQEWKHRECGILALGAVSEGCMEGVEPHLQNLVPYLIQTLDDPKPLVRSITCWTLGRYSRWCVNPPNPQQDRPKYFVPLLEGLLRKVLDNNKRVQEAACSAFATLEEEACDLLIPYLEPILRNLVYAFSKYQHKNLLILYDAIGTLADSVNSALNKKEFIEILMAPLIDKWHLLKDDDRDLFPLLECLSSVTTALGLGFLPYAPPVFERCVKLIHNTLIHYELHQNNPTMEMPDKDFMIVALDLLSGLTQGLGSEIENFVASSQPQLLQLMSLCLRDPVAEVRQSAYALLGDLSMACFSHIKPYLGQFMVELINQVDPRAEHVSVCNNAAWAAGEIALQCGAEMQPWVPPLLERLIPLLTSESTPRTLLENAGITIGRLGLVCPQLVAPHLDVFSEAWCKALRGIRDNEEKDTAFRGLCEMIQSFLYFCDAVVQWQQPPTELNEIFRKILTGFKQMMGPNWEAYTSNFPPHIRQRLHERYAL
ncbi:6952_t:CDS:10 [Funneliformis geosporum]|uniref:6952_t:CDS:1 n=1 Tax=Funneliformis geosporum TaxID=1117311 RepID=A0A9W4SRE8_9GLOM|nr:6952_t:CDS:10 [Funneliformis geosporum]